LPAANYRSNIRTIWPQFILAVIIAALFALIARIGYINVVHGDELAARANRQHMAFRPLPARRGAIYDRRGRILAGSCQAKSLFADPAIIEDKVAAADLIATILNQEPEQFLSVLTRRPNARFVWLARDLDPEVARTFQRLRVYGLGIISEPKRIYPAGSLAGHVLGAVSADNRGLEGLELFWNDTLTGESGREEFIRDAAGRKIWMLNSNYRPPKNGMSIIISIDAVIQQFTEQILDDTCHKFRAKAGCAILMDPNSGEILAWACWPKVDPNIFASQPPQVRRNRGITDPFEPGSVFKPFVAVAALKHQVVDWQEKIFCYNGAYTIGKRILHDHHGYGDLTFPQIVIRSSNIGMAILGQRLGNERLYEAVRAFNFGRPTGIDLPGESRGIVRPLRVWNDYSTTSIPMGQEIAVTAIQLLTAFAALANDGLMVQPRLLRAVVNESGAIIRDNTQPKVIGRAIESHLARTMVRKVLRRVVEEGTGKKAKIPGHMVFGKTGTAQVPKANGRGYKPRAYVASFLGGAPAVAPKLVALVTVREPDPKIGYYGGTVSAPAVRKILENALKYLGIPPLEYDEPAEEISVTAG